MRASQAVLVIVFTLLCIAPAMAGDGLVQELSTKPKFFPKDWVSGYFDFAFAPPHNEPDLNRCTSATGTTVGANMNCAAFARYVGSTYIEFRPIGTGPFRRLFVFFEPHAYMGSNIPQVQYTSSMAPIALERSQGIGWDVTRNLEFRVTTHRVDWLGKYVGNLGVTDLGKNGPLSTYATVSARWYFGGYRHRDTGF